MYCARGAAILGADERDDIIAGFVYREGLDLLDESQSFVGAGAVKLGAVQAPHVSDDSGAADVWSWSPAGRHPCAVSGWWEGALELAWKPDLAAPGRCVARTHICEDNRG